MFNLIDSFINKPRVNFIKDIGMLKRFEDRKKQIDDKKALENEAAKNNCLFKTSKP